MEKKKLVILLSIIGGLLVLGGLTFAYYTSGIINNDTESTIHLASGDMQIEIDGGDIISLSNFAPSNTRPLATKTIRLTGRNTTDVNMPYYLKLIVDVVQLLNKYL